MRTTLRSADSVAMGALAVGAVVVDVPAEPPPYERGCACGRLLLYSPLTLLLGHVLAVLLVSPVALVLSTKHHSIVVHYTS